jgi:LEA14-like dessication related protein
VKNWLGVARSCQFIKAIWLSALAALFVFGFSACSGLSKAPEISLAGIDLLGFGLVEQRFVLRLAIRNPNDVELSVKDLSFELELDGNHFAKGSSETPLLVPQHGEAVLEVVSVSRLASVLKLMRDARKEGRERLVFRMYGSAEVAGLGRLPFERKGEIPVLRLGKLTPD